MRSSACPYNFRFITIEHPQRDLAVLAAGLLLLGPRLLSVSRTTRVREDQATPELTPLIFTNLPRRPRPDTVLKTLGALLTLCGAALVAFLIRWRHKWPECVPPAPSLRHR